MILVRKFPDHRAGHESKAAQLRPVARDRAVAVPRAPAGLSAALRAHWRELWASPVASAFDPVSDYPALRTLFGLYQLADRLDAVAAASSPARVAARLAAAEMAADLHPDDPDLADAVVRARAELLVAVRTDSLAVGTRLRVAGEIRAVEVLFGLSPRARIVLGIALAEGAAAGLGGLDAAASAASAPR